LFSFRLSVFFFFCSSSVKDLSSFQEQPSKTVLVQQAERKLEEEDLDSRTYGDGAGD
jgi:hypothetical protein